VADRAGLGYKQLNRLSFSLNKRRDYQRPESGSIARPSSVNCAVFGNEMRDIHENVLHV
jgi:hypothetical protein